MQAYHLGAARRRADNVRHPRASRTHLGGNHGDVQITHAIVTDAPRLPIGMFDAAKCTVWAHFIAAETASHSSLLIQQSGFSTVGTPNHDFPLSLPEKTFCFDHF
jgi:hypothetical protein